MSPRPGGDVSNSSEFAVLGAGNTAERAVIADSSALERAVRAHLALAAAFVYLFVVIIAVIHDVWFFHAFRIDFLDYAEITDVLSAPLRNPLAVLLSLLPGLLLLWFGELRHRRARRTHGSSSNPGPRLKNPPWRLWTFGAVVLLYSMLFTQLDADRMSDRVKEGGGQRVTFSRVAGVNPDERPILLGSTAHFFFLYYPVRRVTDIVPAENMSLVTVEAISPQKRNQDSAAGSADRSGGGSGSDAMSP